MIRALFRKLEFFLWLVPGFLLWASFPPMGECKDVYLALAPLLWLVRQGNVKRSVVRWSLNGFFFWFATLAWMPAIVKNGGPWPLVVLGWGVLAAYCALYFAAFGYLATAMWAWVRTRNYGWRLAALVFAEPVLWAGLELLRSRLFGGFAWNQLGVVAVNAGFGAPAQLGGVFLLSALVILVNGTLASIAERVLGPFLAARRQPALGEKSVPPAAVPNWARSVETILPFLLVFGFYKLPDYSAAQAQSASDEHLTVALVQRNFPCVFNNGPRENPLVVYSNLLQNVSFLKPDLVVLPESALCEFGEVNDPRKTDVAFARWVMHQAGASAVLAGGGRWTESESFNSAALYTVDSMQVYDKVHLVPFGEFIPGDKLIPILQKLAPVGSCTPGTLKLLELPLSPNPNTLPRQSEAEAGQTPSNPNTIKLGVAICYEDTDAAQVRRLAEMGAQVLVFVTNDSWFSYSQETIQHAWQASARAIETGLPIVRVGNSGVTGIVYPSGRASWLVGSEGGVIVDAPGTMCDRVAIPKVTGPRTWYVRLGDTPLLLAFLLLITTMCVIKYYYEYEKRRYLP